NRVMEESTTRVPFLNLEYFFRLLYEAGPERVTSSLLEDFGQWFIHMWTTLGAVSFVFSIAALGLLAYSSIRYKQIIAHHHHEYHSDLDPVEAEHAKDRSRWVHIQGLIESGQERDWREAIME